MPRQRIIIEGIVQGVGFRPHVYQAALKFGIAGWVLNDSNGVLVEAEGKADALKGFLDALRNEPPPLSCITRFETVGMKSTGEPGFAILSSRLHSDRNAQISPDTHVCEDCLRELFDPRDRRFRYPFINCTRCGPRYTIITSIPYDRENTTMGVFPMCAACSREFEDPSSRRFHAQPVACFDCGPRLRVLNAGGDTIPVQDPVRLAGSLLKEGKIGAIKGVGGYHLAVDACNDAAVGELRRRKARDEKPFALMVCGPEEVSRIAHVSAPELRLLQGPERPIALLRKRTDHRISEEVAPRNRDFGVMLPYAPHHYLLLREGFLALVMTSANRTDEPVAFRDEDALERLSGISDFFLTHDREIHIRTDDSVVRIAAGRPLLLRRSRGYVPRSVPLLQSPTPILALGAELKNAVCVTRGNRAYMSQYIGDLKNPRSCEALAWTVDHLRDILEVQPEIVVHDLHPDYFSTRFAREYPAVRRIAVQHHHAHMASCLTENGIEGDAIGVVLDGLGFGPDGRIWGGEFLVGGCGGFRRAGHFAYAPMPGGDAAAREPFRMALSYLYMAYGSELPPVPLIRSLSSRELGFYGQMMEKEILSPRTSSCGRLFDGISALAGVRHRNGFEGQAAMELEMVVDHSEEGAYPYLLRREEGRVIFDYQPLIRAVAEDVLDGCGPPRISAMFHNALARMIVEMCSEIRRETGLDRVCLSGGVFQNKILLERAVPQLEESDFQVFTQSLVPPNDGGIALGQAAVAAMKAHS